MSVIQIKWAHSITVGNQTAKQLLCFLASHHFGKPGMEFRNSTMSKILEVSERTIQKAKKHLVDNGFITVTPQYSSTGKQISNIIYLNVPQQDVDNYMAELEGGRSKCTPRGELRSPSPRTTFTLPPPKNDVQHIVKKEEIRKNSYPNNKGFNNKYNNKELIEERLSVDNFKSERQERRAGELRCIVPEWAPGHPGYDSLHGIIAK